jgi:hypothetical protein
MKTNQWVHEQSSEVIIQRDKNRDQKQTRIESKFAVLKISSRKGGLTILIARYRKDDLPLLARSFKGGNGVSVPILLVNMLDLRQSRSIGRAVKISQACCSSNRGAQERLGPLGQWLAKNRLPDLRSEGIRNRSQYLQPNPLLVKDWVIGFIKRHISKVLLIIDLEFEKMKFQESAGN